MRRLILVLALAALALPGQALAKEVESVAVCGVGACSDAGHPQQFITLFQDPGGLGTENVVSVLEPVPVQSYYRVVVTMGGPNERPFRTTFFFVQPNLYRMLDERGVLSIPFRRLPLSSPLVAEVRRLASKLEAFPAPQVVGAVLNDRQVARPAQLIRVFE